MEKTGIDYKQRIEKFRLNFSNRLASSRRSVSQDAAQKTACKKINKSAVRGSERAPVGKLNKRSFRPLIDHLQRPVT